MILNIIYILCGMVAVLWGADRLTDGAVAMAERWHIPQIVIGLTIVACGTSMPEFFVSLVSAINQTPDLAVGNIVGSNIFNALLIVGVSAAIAPIAIQTNTIHRDMPFAIVASALLLVLCIDGEISRVDAGVMTAMFVFYMYTTLHGAKNNQEQPSAKQPMKLWQAILWVFIGLACLVVGSDVFVKGATGIAETLGVSEAVIGLTIVAGGTSLPELATSAVAARKGNSGIAIGNVLGSNVFNILMILGITGLITPMAIVGITMTDLSVMVLSMGLLWLFSFTKHTIERWEGWVLILAFAAYLAHLLQPYL